MDLTACIFGCQTGVELWSGNVIDLLNPDPKKILMSDIAKNLSLINRWNGCIRGPYSVAQHSILVAEQTPLKYRRHAILHDAHEAFLGDDIRPKKAWLQALGVWDTIHSAVRKIDLAIFEAFDLSLPTAPCRLSIKEADNIVARAEAKQLRQANSQYNSWDWNGVPIKDVKIKPWSHERACGDFLLAVDEIWSETT